MASSPIDYKAKFAKWLAADLFKLTDELAALTVTQRAAMLENGIPEEMIGCSMETMFNYRKAVRGEKIGGGGDSEGSAEAQAQTEPAGKRKYLRNAPTESTKSLAVGTEQLGQDGKTLYRVTVVSNGSKRWLIAK